MDGLQLPALIVAIPVGVAAFVEVRLLSEQAKEEAQVAMATP